MSTTSLTPRESFVPTAGAVGRTRLRITARGRRVLAALAAAPVAAAIAASALGAVSAAATAESGPAPSFEQVTVLPGDTLWSIAAEVAPHTDPRSVISEIRQLNALSDEALWVGQDLALPAAYSR